MSQWTHIIGALHLDCFGKSSEDDIEEALKETFGITWCPGQSPTRSKTLKYTPFGSEGGVWWHYHNDYDATYRWLHSDTHDDSFIGRLKHGRGVMVFWGDLRDYNDVEAIMKWVQTPLPEDLCIRLGTVAIYVDDVGLTHRIFNPETDQWQ